VVAGLVGSVDIWVLELGVCLGDELIHIGLKAAKGSAEILRVKKSVGLLCWDMMNLCSWLDFVVGSGGQNVEGQLGGL